MTEASSPRPPASANFINPESVHPPFGYSAVIATPQPPAEETMLMAGILLHGAWHGPWCWDSVAEPPRDHGTESTRCDCLVDATLPASCSWPSTGSPHRDRGAGGPPPPDRHRLPRPLCPPRAGRPAWPAA
jgi:hypothetical protein